MKNKEIFVIVLLISIAFTGYPQSPVDVLIVGNPRAYSILNRYEEPLTSVQLNNFLPYSPLEIVKEEATLGDGITSALKCIFNNEVFYLLRDDEGKLIGDNKNPYKQRFTKVQRVQDTVLVVQSKALLSAQQYPAAGARSYLSRDAQCLRLYKYNGYYYVKSTGADTHFGWCQFPQDGSWKKVVCSIPKEDKIISTALQGRILARIDAANKAYEQFFMYFTTVTGQQKSIPQWRCTAGDDRISCTLTGPYAKTDQLEESTRYLLQDLENMIIGKPFEMEYQQRQITIMVRE